MKPELSVLLPAWYGLHTVTAALNAWEAQTCRDRIEILLLCPDHLLPTAEQIASLPPGQIVVPIGPDRLHVARARAIRQASADYIVLAEDHCLPDPDWAAAMIRRTAERWDVIGPSMRPGNRDSDWADGAFLLGYSEWMAPVAGGPAKIVCGWNVTVRARCLRDLGAELPGELRMGAFLVRRLRAEGCRLYLEDRARMRHFDPPRLNRQTVVFGVLGLGFGRIRTERWPLPARLLFFFAAPAIAFLHWKRAFVHYRRAARRSGMGPRALAAAALLASLWGVGEAAGAWMPLAWIEPHLWREEVKPVRQEDVDRSTARERLTMADTPILAGTARD